MFCKNFDDIRNKLLKMGVVTAPSYKHFSSLFISAASVLVEIVSRLELNPQTMADGGGGGMIVLIRRNLKQDQVHVMGTVIIKDSCKISDFVCNKKKTVKGLSSQGSHTVINDFCFLIYFFLFIN